MPSLSSCPQCCRPVRTPDGHAPSTRVQCPWCREEFDLSRALEPPELIVLEADPPAAISVDDAREDDMAVFAPEAGVVPAASDAEERIALDAEDADETSSAVRFAGHMEDAASGERESIGLSGLNLGEDSDEDDSAPAAVQGRRRKNEPNMGKEMLKVAIGGIIGLVLAYAILLGFGRDPLGLFKGKEMRERPKYEFRH